MKIEVKKTITHGEFAKYMVDKFGIESFERNLDGGEWFGAPSNIYNASINLKPAKYDDFAHSIRIDEDGVTLKTFEEITEDTKFKRLIEIEQDDTCYMWLNTSVSAEKQVNDCKNLSKEFHAYIDGEFKLIWTREKGLVE